MDDIEDTTSKARKILSMMKRRVVTNKLVLIFIILILFAAICIVVWVRWIGPMIARRQGAPAAPPMGPAPVALPVAPPPHP
jgi:polyferredoxin